MAAVAVPPSRKMRSPQRLPQRLSSPPTASGWHPPPVVLGAYAASPTPTATSRAPGGEEAEFYDALLSLNAGGELDGFEVPLLQGGVMHALDEPWLLSKICGAGVYACVLTLIPATMAAVSRDPAFGLASADPRGRAAALELARAGLAAVGRLNAAAGRPIVAAVELHSAPPRPGGASNAAALQESLVELATWDWQGASLVVEHCDAVARGVAAPAFPPAKGFLTLEEELSAVRGARAQLAARGAASAPLSVCVNWARSVLETRDPGTAAAHAAAAREAGLLGGLIFSGCSGEPVEAYGGAWKDSHWPMPEDAPGSLLTERAVALALRAAGFPPGGGAFFTGAKVTLQGGERSAEERAAACSRVCAAIKAAYAAQAALQ